MWLKRRHQGASNDVVVREVYNGRLSASPMSTVSAPVIELNGIGPFQMAIGQQLASLGPNQFVVIKQRATPTETETVIAKLAFPSFGQSTHDGPTWEDLHDLQRRMNELQRERSRSTRPHRTKYEAEVDDFGKPMGQMDIDGEPGFVFRDAAGRYKAYRITSVGFEYARDVTPR